MRHVTAVNVIVKGIKSERRQNFINMENPSRLSFFALIISPEEFRGMKHLPDKRPLAPRESRDVTGVWERKEKGSAAMN